MPQAMMGNLKAPGAAYLEGTNTLVCRTMGLHMQDKSLLWEVAT